MGVNAKNGKGSATLSMAYAGARLGKAVLAGLNGTPTTECAYVMSDIMPGLPYFTSKVTFGKSGVQKVHPLGKLNAHEEARWPRPWLPSRKRSSLAWTTLPRTVSNNLSSLRRIGY